MILIYIENFVFKALEVVVVPEQIIRNDAFRYRWYLALAMHIKPFLNNQAKRRQCPD